MYDTTNTTTVFKIALFLLSSSLVVLTSFIIEIIPAQAKAKKAERKEITGN